MALHQLCQEKKKLFNMHLNQCHEAVNFEFELITLRSMAGTRDEVHTTQYPMAGKCEEESHDLHLLWFTQNDWADHPFYLAIFQMNSSFSKSVIKVFIAIARANRCDCDASKSGCRDHVLYLQIKAMANNVNLVERHMEEDVMGDEIFDHEWPKWIENNHRIDFSEFTDEAKTWLSIICSRVIPLRNEINLSLDRALLICDIMDVIPINVG
ncbi:hypothetical protein H5410_028124 [Solanum commersonii]|uniref:Putative plant transposon protein domain-containing protein n=1 Tax=Solanum commersonii TaxID=4109 RepID=A0A9J5Z3X0_SOLCO|nr:hypothetical protein H5410_028124 [Solanum commersonii]